MCINPKKLLVLSAPSGGGKSTVARYVLQNYPEFEFSISATTRPKREFEVDGKDYYFISKEEFLKKIQANEFVEYEEIFGNYYGTLKSEVEKKLSEGKKIIFDIDVKGALSIKKAYPEESFLVFLLPPSVDDLVARLKKRGSENENQIALRIKRVEEELSYQNYFDYIIINEVLKNTFKEIDKVVNEYFKC